jgi:hypothetical protein
MISLFYLHISKGAGVFVLGVEGSAPYLWYILLDSLAFTFKPHVCYGQV